MIAGFSLFGCNCAHLVHELLLRLADVEQRLPGLGIAKEDDEIDGMARAQRHADLRVVLEAADARAVAGARIDDHVRAARRIDHHAFGRHDADQRVVDRPRQRAAVDDGLVVEVQHGRLSCVHVLDVLVAALAQRVPEQDRALRAVDRVVVPVRPQPRRRRRITHQRADVGVERAAQPFGEMLVRKRGALAQHHRHLGGDVLRT